jgi:hypothetical protein
MLSRVFGEHPSAPQLATTPPTEEEDEGDQTSWRNMTHSTGSLEETTILDFFESVAESAQGPIDFHHLEKGMDPLKQGLGATHRTFHHAHRAMHASASAPADCLDIDVFAQESRHMRRWDILMAMLLLYTAIFTAFEVAFGSVGPNASNLDMVVTCAFALDIVLRFNRAVEDELTNTLITRRHAIAWRYLKGSFLLDVASTVPWDMLLAQGESNSGSSPRLLRLLRMGKLLRLLRTHAVVQSLMKESSWKMSTW